MYHPPLTYRASTLGVTRRTLVTSLALSLSLAGAITPAAHAATETSDPRYLTRVGSTLYFSADDGSSGRELWKSNGTAGGTKLVKDVNTLHT